MAFERRGLQRIYQRAAKPEDLPWHREEPPRLLQKALAARAAPGRALDLGCGAGVFSAYLARQGYEVTGVDFLPEPLRMARERAEREGVAVRFVEADVLTWQESRPFEVVLDSGCLHSLNPAARQRYKSQLLHWLAPGGDYVLVHFGKRHSFDWRPIGPRRRTRLEIVAFFAPELELCDYDEQVWSLPFPIGPRVRIATYWFRRR